MKGRDARVRTAGGGCQSVTPASASAHACLRHSVAVSITKARSLTSSLPRQLNSSASAERSLRHAGPDRSRCSMRVSSIWTGRGVTDFLSARLARVFMLVPERLTDTPDRIPTFAFFSGLVGLFVPLLSMALFARERSGSPPRACRGIATPVACAKCVLIVKCLERCLSIGSTPQPVRRA